MLRAAIVLSSLFVIAACVTSPPPKDEYTLAWAAQEAARAVEAARHSPGFWQMGEVAYKNGQRLFEEREYKRAKTEFLRSKEAFEKAENSARMIRFKSGEVL